MDDEAWLDCDFDDDDIEFICEKPGPSRPKQKAAPVASRKRKLKSSHVTPILSGRSLISTDLWLNKFKPTAVKEVSDYSVLIQDVSSSGDLIVGFNIKIIFIIA